MFSRALQEINLLIVAIQHSLTFQSKFYVSYRRLTIIAKISYIGVNKFPYRNNILTQHKKRSVLVN